MKSGAPDLVSFSCCTSVTRHLQISEGKCHNRGHNQGFTILKYSLYIRETHNYLFLICVSFCYTVQQGVIVQIIITFP